jgi:hypothetical protein
VKKPTPKFQRSWLMATICAQSGSPITVGGSHNRDLGQMVLLNWNSCSRTRQNPGDYRDSLRSLGCGLQQAKVAGDKRETAPDGKSALSPLGTSSGPATTSQGRSKEREVAHELAQYQESRCGLKLFRNLKRVTGAGMVCLLPASAAWLGTLSLNAHENNVRRGESSRIR